MSVLWYFAVGRDVQGPVDSTAVRTMAKNGQLLPQHYLCKAGTQQWVQACEVKGLFDALLTTAPPPPFLDKEPNWGAREINPISN